VTPVDPYNNIDWRKSL